MVSFFVNSETTPREDKLTVAFIYQITKFTQWPNEVSDGKNNLPISLCTIDNISKEMQNGFAEISKKTSQKRSLSVSSLSNSMQLLTDKNVKCDLIYFPENTWRKLSKSQLATINKATLTIGKNREFLKNGGVLSLILVDNKMKIFISHQALAESNVKLQSRFIALTKSVDE